MTNLTYLPRSKVPMNTVKKTNCCIINEEFTGKLRGCRSMANIVYTAKNTVISPNFQVWKFCGKVQVYKFPHQEIR